MGFKGSGIMEEKESALLRILKELRTTVASIEAVAIVSVEGLPITSDLPGDIDETRIAAMTAAMLSLGERAAIELGKGELERIFVEGKEGHVIASGAGENAVLTVSTTQSAKLGLIFLEMKRAVEKISEIL